MDSLVKKNKENKKRPEQKKNSLKQKEETPKVVPTPPKKDKKVWKQKEEAPKSTSIPPKSNKMVWRPKKVQSSVSLLRARMYHHQAKGERRRVLLIGL